MSSTIEKPVRAPEAEQPPRLSHRQIVTILSGLVCGMFLAALDQTIVGTAIVRIANDLDGFDLQAWVSTAYLITSTIVTPIYGKLSDIYGRKPFYLVAITIFVAGSLASTFAQSMYELAAFRAVQGLGAGGLMSLAMTIIGDIVPPRERSRYQGYIMTVFGLSTVLGPVLGGLFAGFDSLGGVAGWRWVFLINVPIGIIALLVVAKVLNVPHQRHDHRIDWWGALTLVVAVVPFLVVAEQGQKWGWDDEKAIYCYAVGGVGVLAFILVERVMKDAALIPLRLFRNSTFSLAILGSVIVGVAMFGAITMMPQFLQVVQGYSPTKSGLLMLPLMMGIMISSILSGLVTSKTGRYKVFAILGTVMIAGGAFLFAQVEHDSGLWHPLLAAAVIGLGLGQCMQTLVLAAQNAVPRSDMGASTASATFFRQIGGTAGVALFLTILFNVLPGNITKALGAAAPTGSGSGPLDLSSNTSGIQDLPEAIRTPVLIGFTESITTVFYVAGAVALLATLVLLAMKEIPLADPGTAPPPVEPTQAVDPVEPAAAVVQDDDEPALIGGWLPSSGEPESDDHETPPITTAGLPVTASNGDHFQDTPPVIPHRRPLNRFDGAFDLPTRERGQDAHGAPVTGHVRRQDGTHVPGAAVALLDQRGRQVSRGTGAPDGSYSVPTHGPGGYVLIVSAHGHQPKAWNVVVGDGPETVDVTLVGAGELTGTVKITATGAPLANATVTLIDSRGEVNAASISTAEGAYAFSQVGAGVYTLVVSASGYRSDAVTLTMPDKGLLRHDIGLTGSVQLSGTARTEDDRIVADARITVLDGKGEVAATARTDSQGKYVVHDLPAGAYTVIASGYPPVSSEVLLADGEADHDVHLTHDHT
ncbi:DHA2 family efflux MFS transporter permease subunit [Umezawaea sp. Da 62-37]|uniref:MFS transporter n=1 Tax=Umezawaea sp. Da 62-37 TaxID=3075927 RepID=UPI0028F744A0|nr:DHA2 family efflux MFS transporter permease subunit [Umezawaea sp. Da 62-37]WNV85630.1 DHA2 family efflux MFS transporter permease subunit [Umezawaea sp. Da 62-37]